MSRGQQGQVFNQTQGESKTAFGNAENDYSLANQDIGNFQDQVKQLGAENPFTVGGEYQNNQNMVLANTSDAMAEAAGAQLQGEAARTGQNPAGAIGATESIEQANERSLAGQQAAANQERIGQEAGYNTNVTNEYGKVPGMETAVGEGETGLYNGALKAEEGAAATPSFLETLEGQLAKAGESFVGGLGQGYGSQLAKNS
jgi:hypothetical protein